MTDHKKTEAQNEQAGETQAAAFGDSIRLGEEGQRLFIGAATVGVIFLALSLLIGLTGGRYQQFAHSYLVSFMWVLSIALGALFWVTLQHLMSARWSVAIRRIGELLAANMTLLAILALPIVVPLLFGSSALFPWADAQRVHDDHLLHHKSPYLNVTFFAVRFLVYFGTWALLSRLFLVRSVRQDVGGGDELTRGLKRVSGPAMIAFGVTLTFAAFDFLMSLDPAWFSTIFGVYYFAGCVVAVHATLALSLMWLQRNGHLKNSVTVEHFHDIGKMLFAFTVFWAYIAFSQFMLIWYANIPEETHFFHVRYHGGWVLVSWLLIIGHFAFPFLGLMSRYAKRNKRLLGFFAVWLLVMHWVDLYWLVMPNLSPSGPPLHLLDVTSFIALASLLLAGVVYQARKVNLLPIKDPRLKVSLAFENV
jgi:hypothetical protein